MKDPTPKNGNNKSRSGQENAKNSTPAMPKDGTSANSTSPAQSPDVSPEQVIRHESDMADPDDEQPDPDDASDDDTSDDDTSGMQSANNVNDEPNAASNTDDGQPDGDPGVTENAPYKNRAKYRMVPPSDDDGLFSSSRS